MSSSRFTKSDVGPPLIGALLRMPWEAVRDRMLERLHAAGFEDLDAPHLNLLQYPGPDGVRPSDLASRLRVSKQALNYLLGQLERLGYLERRADRSDLRARRIFLTPRGRRALRVIREAVEDIESDWAQLLGRDDFARLKASLQSLSHQTP